MKAYDPRDSEQSPHDPETWKETDNVALVSARMMSAGSQVEYNSDDWADVARMADYCDEEVKVLADRAVVTPVMKAIFGEAPDDTAKLNLSVGKPRFGVGGIVAPGIAIETTIPHPYDGWNWVTFCVVRAAMPAMRPIEIGGHPRVLIDRWSEGVDEDGRFVVTARGRQAPTGWERRYEWLAPAEPTC